MIDRARRAGVGETKQGRADQLARESPPLLRMVIDGELSLEAALASLKMDREKEPKGEKPDPHADCNRKIAELEQQLGPRQADAALLQERAELRSLRLLVVDLEDQLGQAAIEIAELKQKLAQHQSAPVANPASVRH